ncbi:MAG: 50S ribosomal protein L6 [Chlamydiales bacterium]
MSRKARMPIPIPKGVEVKLDKNMLTVKGPKGTLTRQLEEAVEVAIEPESLAVSMSEAGYESKFHGLYWSLIFNMVKGVSEGYEKRLEMIGVGYRAQVQGNQLNLQVGFSHPTMLLIPEGIEVNVEKNTIIVIKGIDNQRIGQFAETIRKKRPPEPYKGKGIRYVAEYVRRKAGKAAKK